MTTEPEGLPSYVLNYGGADHLTDWIQSMTASTTTLADLCRELRCGGPLSEEELNDGAHEYHQADHMHGLLVGAVELVGSNGNRWKYLYDALAQAFFDYHAARNEWRGLGGRV